MSTGQSYRALVLEDEPDASVMLSHMLRKQGYTTVNAMNISEAIDILNNQEFEVMFLDHQLPDGTCFDLLKHFKKIDSSMFICSAFLDEDEKILAKEMGILNYIEKPLTQDKIVGSLKKFNLKWL